MGGCCGPFCRPEHHTVDREPHRGQWTGFGGREKMSHFILLTGEGTVQRTMADRSICHTFVFLHIIHDSPVFQATELGEGTASFILHTW